MFVAPGERCLPADLALQGYRQKDYFIATQAPLSHTVDDFWRMVWEWRCHSIVMLTELKEREQVQYRRSSRSAGPRVEPQLLLCYVIAFILSPGFLPCVYVCVCVVCVEFFLPFFFVSGCKITKEYCNIKQHSCSSNWVSISPS